jgi:hypothetical protein
MEANIGVPFTNTILMLAQGRMTDHPTEPNIREWWKGHKLADAERRERE